MAGTIYLVTNNLNGKQYVGQTIVGDRRGHGTLVTRAYRKYGKQNFSYEHICSNIDNRKTLNFIEKFWIKVMDCRIPNGYNIDHGGSSKDKVSDETREKLRISHLGKVPTEEARKKLSIAHKSLPDSIKQYRASFLRKKPLTPEAIEKIRIGNLGKTRSEETKNRIRVANIGKKLSDATKLKLSEAAKRQWARQKGEV